MSLFRSLYSSLLSVMCVSHFVSFVTLSLSLSLSLYLMISLLLAANHILWIIHFVKKRKDGAKIKKKLTLLIWILTGCSCWSCMIWCWSSPECSRGTKQLLVDMLWRLLPLCATDCRPIWCSHIYCRSYSKCSYKSSHILHYLTSRPTSSHVLHYLTSRPARATAGCDQRNCATTNVGMQQM